MNIFVDFSNVEQNNIGLDKANSTKYNVDYDDTTLLYYKSMRIKKEDPISFEILTDTNSFKFNNMWDPYTGNRLDEDPYGPLYFNPITLLQHIYHHKLNGLWVDPVDEEGGYYAGYYGENMGSGEDMEIIGRGIYPERYLFRLPISNCYLKKNHNLSLVTMGPKLTDREICEIDRLIVKYWSHHKMYNKMYKKIGSLYKLKCYYDVAISKNPSKMDLSGLSLCTSNDLDKQQNKDAYLNRLAVDAIKNMSHKI